MASPIATRKWNYGLGKTQHSTLIQNSTQRRCSVIPKIDVGDYSALDGDYCFCPKHPNDSLSGIKSYNGYLNGNWILFEYDNKTKKITHNFSDGIVAEGANDLKVVVIDNVGNSSTFVTHFFRSQKK